MTLALQSLQRAPYMDLLLPGLQAHRNTLRRIMIFNQQSRPEANDLLKILPDSLNTHGVRFDHAIFCTNVTRREKG